jgi:hypothetical protein
MSDKRYKTIGQVGIELDDLVLLVERTYKNVLTNLKQLMAGGELVDPKANVKA